MQVREKIANLVSLEQLQREAEEVAGIDTQRLNTPARCEMREGRPADRRECTRVSFARFGVVY